MKTAWIFVTYHTSHDVIQRLEKEICDLFHKDYRIYWIDNTDNNKGYAEGVNEGIQKAMSDGAELLVVCNTDISLLHIDKKKFFEGSSHFDIWGLGMKQRGVLYYGGELDRWRMSGGLVKEKPNGRFVERDFVSGSLMIIQRKVIESIGRWDESYFMYYEDVDFCKRAVLAGFRVGIDSALMYEHMETSNTWSEKSYYLARNRLRFLLTYGSLPQKVYEFIRLPKTIYKERATLRDILKRNSFLKNFLSLNVSSFIGKLLNFILFIVLIRYLNPEEYGIYTLVWAHISLLSPFLDLGTSSYGLLYLSKEKDDKINNLFSLRTYVSVVIFILTIALGIFLRFDTKVIFYIALTSCVIFYNSISGLFLIVSSVKEKAWKASIISVITNAVLIALLIGAVLLSGRLLAVFAVTGIMYIVYAGLYVILLKKEVKKLTLRFEPRAWKNVLSKSVVFILISFFAGLYFKLDIYLLTKLKGIGEVGIYSAGYKFLEAFMFIVASYNLISLPGLKKAFDGGGSLVKKKIMKDAVFVLFIGSAVAAGVSLIGPFILPFLLKGHYADSVKVMSIVIWALPIILVSSIFLNILYVLKKTSIVLVIFIAQVVINFVLNMLLIPHFSYFASSYITLTSEILNCIFAGLFVWKYLREWENDRI